MASVFHLCCDAFNIKQKVLEKYSNFAETDKQLYFSAVIIQKTWRGYVVRKMIGDWNKQANIIQKYVRGWLVKLHLPDYLQMYHYNLSVVHYNAQATKIQALWRGYCTRKLTMSFKTVLTERREIEEVSKKMQEQMKNAFEEMHHGVWNETRQCLEKVLTILFNRHHLLRTKVREGIFSVHGSNKLSCVEKILDSFPLTEYMKELHSQFHAEQLHLVSQKKDKRFDLNTNIKFKKYERMLLSQD